jgi:hypothetical protein
MLQGENRSCGGSLRSEERDEALEISLGRRRTKGDYQTSDWRSLERGSEEGFTALT